MEDQNTYYQLPSTNHPPPTITHRHPLTTYPRSFSHCQVFTGEEDKLLHRQDYIKIGLAYPTSISVIQLLVNDTFFFFRFLFLFCKIFLLPLESLLFTNIVSLKRQIVSHVTRFCWLYRKYILVCICKTPHEGLKSAGL